MENIKPVKSDFEFVSPLVSQIKVSLEVNYSTKDYMVMVYIHNEYFETIDKALTGDNADFDIALISTVKYAIEFAKGELSK